MTTAAFIPPPTEGNIEVLSLTTSASSEQELSVPQSSEGRYVHFIADVVWYVTFSTNGHVNNRSEVADPDENATSGDGRTWRIPADTVLAIVPTRITRFFKAKGSASGTLRWYFA